METIYRVCYNTLGSEQEIFFKSFLSAKKFVQNMSCVDFIDGEYFIGGESCKTYIENDTLNIRQKVNNDIQYYICIEPVELPFEIRDNIWKLSLISGYASTMIYGDEHTNTTISYFASKKQGRKYATRTRELKRFPRSWIRKSEESMRRDPNGYGQDYLHLRKMHVNS